MTYETSEGTYGNWNNGLVMGIEQTLTMDLTIKIGFQEVSGNW